MHWDLYPASRFSEFSKQWDNLNRQSCNSIVLDSRFVSSLLNHFSNGKELIAVLGDNLQPQAMGIIRRVGLGKWATFQPSQAPIGCWLQDPSLPIARIGKELSRKLPGLTLIFSITQQDPDLLPRPENKGALTTLDYIETAKISVNCAYEMYWSQRSKNLRQGLRRQRNKLSREGIATKLAIITRSEDIASAIEAYGNLESIGWKAAKQTAIHKDNTQGRFYREMLEKFSETSQCVIYQYWYNDNLSATDLCIHDCNSIVILKTTYDEKIRETSPAMLMRQESFENIFDRKSVRKIEFFGKTMEWHRKWSVEFRHMYHLNIYSDILRYFPWTGKAKKILSSLR